MKLRLSAALPLLGMALAATAVAETASAPGAPVMDAGHPKRSETATPPTASAVAHWRSLRYGMFIHWGPVSLTDKEIGWSRGAKNGTPIEEYDNLYKRFNPVKFDADAWVAIAKAGGMRYIVLTTKHHDGFCLWDTKLTDYNIMNTPFKRDVVKELAEACKKQNMPFGVYYSTCDWHFPDFPFTSPGGGVRRNKSDMDSYNQYLLGQIEELLTKYGPILTVWNDVPQEFKGRGVKTINLVRKLQPEILINNRTGDGGDYDTPEQRIGGFNMNRPWESCMTISSRNAWAWGGEKDGVKSLNDCLRMLVLGNGGDGNVLLNVGPRPEGDIAPIQANRLKEIGDWLAKYGESLMETRGGPYKPTKDFSSTRRDKTVYLHLLKRDGADFKLPALPAKVTSAELLTGGEVKVAQTDDALALVLSPKDPAAFDVIVKLTLDTPAMDIAPIDFPKKK